MVVIFGGGGVASEVIWLLHRRNEAQDVLIVVENEDAAASCRANGMSAVSEKAYFSRPLTENCATYLAIGSPSTRERVAVSLSGLNLDFPALVDADVSMDERPGRLLLGRGTIIYPTVSLTTNIRLGKFVHVNPGASIAHHCVIGDFTTVCPGTVIAGSVSIGRRCFLGAGAILRDGVTLSDSITIGAGATVVTDLNEPGVYIGTPARWVSAG